MYTELLSCARRARDKAYAPYSGFRVGAAVWTCGGEIFTGCNVENAAYSLTICAERVAVFRAVASGARCFQALAVTGTENPCFPCGSCRQVLSEFGADIEVVIDRGTEYSPKIMTVRELLPEAFAIDSMKGRSTTSPEDHG